eukprot:3145271-Lingulodinium_polyedra.AAC.1
MTLQQTRRPRGHWPPSGALDWQPDSNWHEKQIGFPSLLFAHSPMSPLGIRAPPLPFPLA